MIENIILITDPNNDPDDLVSFVGLANFVHQKAVSLKAVVATYGDEVIRLKRAKFAKGAFLSLGINVPVAVGCDYEQYNNIKGNGYYEEAGACKLEALGEALESSAEALLKKVYEQAEAHSLTVLINAIMPDIACFIEKYASLFIEKTKKIVVMGGYEFDEEGKVVPARNSHNLIQCYEAAQRVFETALEHNIQLVLVPKETIYEVSVDGQTFFDVLKIYQNPIAQNLFASYKMFVYRIWDSVSRGKNQHFTLERFNQVFIADGEEVFASDDVEIVFEKVRKINLYDLVSALATLEDYWKKYGAYEKIRDGLFVAKISKRSVFIDELYCLMDLIKINV
ncbi:MAG: nucleoside hydrolase [Alphaproteobacteria bacterium]|nr:nucleoside hydrolase [Alphaproteobacteria bacterium]